MANPIEHFRRFVAAMPETLLYNSHNSLSWSPILGGDPGSCNISASDLRAVLAELDQLRAARDRTIEQMETYTISGGHGMSLRVNCRQVINLLSLTWPDGNYEAPVTIHAALTCCRRCDSQDIQYRDALNAPYCEPCADVVAVMSPDVQPMRPIKEADHA